jgi:hypothetical protein
MPIRYWILLTLLLLAAGGAVAAPLPLREPAAATRAPAAGAAHAPAPVVPTTPRPVVPAPLHPVGIGAARPAPQAYMEIAGVAGRSQDAAHRGWIELLSATLQDRGVDPAGSGCRQLALSATKIVDSASPQLASLAASHRLADVTIDGSAGRRTLRRAVIESVAQLGTAVGANAPAHESVSVLGLECMSGAPPRGIAVKNGPARGVGIVQAPPVAPRPGIALMPAGPIAQTVSPLRLEVAPGEAPKAVTLAVPALRLEATRPFSSLSVAAAKVASGGVSVAVAPLRVEVAAAAPPMPIALSTPPLTLAVQPPSTIGHR